MQWIISKWNTYSVQFNINTRVITVANGFFLLQVIGSGRIFGIIRRMTKGSAFGAVTLENFGHRFPVKFSMLYGRERILLPLVRGMKSQEMTSYLGRWDPGQAGTGIKQHWEFLCWCTNLHSTDKLICKHMVNTTTKGKKGKRLTEPSSKVIGSVFKPPPSLLRRWSGIRCKAWAWLGSVIKQEAKRIKTPLCIILGVKETKE